VADMARIIIDGCNHYFGIICIIFCAVAKADNSTHACRMEHMLRYFIIYGVQAGASHVVY
jgi:hypothetical protein